MGDNLGLGQIAAETFKFDINGANQEHFGSQGELFGSQGVVLPHVPLATRLTLRGGSLRNYKVSFLLLSF